MTTRALAFTVGSNTRIVDGDARFTSMEALCRVLNEVAQVCQVPRTNVTRAVRAARRRQHQDIGSWIF
eukprot:3184164-Pyramimonas_sp.AAC.1